LKVLTVFSIIFKKKEDKGFIEAASSSIIVQCPEMEIPEDGKISFSQMSRRVQIRSVT